jgi:hypothetical protein
VRVPQSADVVRRQPAQAQHAAVLLHPGVQLPKFHDQSLTREHGLVQFQHDAIDHVLIQQTHDALGQRAVTAHAIRTTQQANE